MGLVFQQRDAVIDATEMPVGGMKKAHGDDRQDGRGRSFAHLAMQVRCANARPTPFRAPKRVALKLLQAEVARRHLLGGSRQRIH